MRESVVLDKKRSVLNVGVSIISKFILLFAALIVRRLLIQRIGNDVNGLNSLYTDIIGMLSVAELGVGSAIVYSMYSPIVAGNVKAVSALYGLYRKLYRIIGAVILIAGLAVCPFLPKLIGDFDSIGSGVNVYLTYCLTVISVFISYIYSAKSSLIEAHKNNYITTGITTVSKLVMYGLQIGAILIWKSFTAFAVCKIFGSLVSWLLTEVIVRRKYGDIIKTKEPLDKEDETGIVRNIKAMFMHKIGTILVSGVDSVIISAFIGVVILGKYNNYVYIAGVVSSVLALFFSPLTSVVGHLCAEKDPVKTKHYFNYFYSMNLVLGLVFFLGYYAVIDGLVAFFFGEGLEINSIIVFVITLNQFTRFMRSAPLLFRNASGTFYNDRWKPVAEGTVNLLLSLILVIVLPDYLKIAGVIGATVITTLGICHIIEPYVIFRHVFEISPKRFYVKNYLYMALFAVCLLGIKYTSGRFGIEGNDITGILINGVISLGISAAALGLAAVFDRELRDSVKAASYYIKSRIKA